MNNVCLIIRLAGLLWMGSIGAQQETLVIDSGVADYDGTKVILRENVFIEHELGDISANEVILASEEKEQRGKFAFLTIKDQVNIRMKDGGLLTCALAELDYRNLVGKFSGDPTREYVVYSENCQNKTGIATPLVIKSRQMDIKIVRDDVNEAKGLPPKSYVSKVFAKDNVSVDYNQEFVVSADSSSYERLPVGADAAQPQPDVFGLITLCASEKNGVCQVTDRNGDVIKARNISIDTLGKEIHFNYPKGVIYTDAMDRELCRVDFSSDSMVWNEPQDVLILKGHVIVNQEGMGRLINNEEVRLYRSLTAGSKRLKMIDSSGETTLVRQDDGKGGAHSLTAYGKMTIDHEKLQIHLDSPRNEKGKVLEGKQVYYVDRLGEIYADKVLVSYDYINNQIVPAKITLKGNVHLLNRTAADSDDQGKFLQYAMADIVEYLPIKKKMYFKSEKDHRVLFFDKLNNIQISAPALKMVRDPNSKKDSIQGIGDVRFSFVEQELEELRKRFNLQKDN